MSDVMNRVQISLKDGVAVITDRGDHEIHVGEDGILTVTDIKLREKTGGAGTVGVFSSGAWTGAFLMTVVGE